MGHCRQDAFGSRERPESRGGVIHDPAPRQAIIVDIGREHGAAGRLQGQNDRAVAADRLPDPLRNPVTFEQDQRFDRLGAGESRRRARAR
jgi:hypothetical protein